VLVDCFTYFTQRAGPIVLSHTFHTRTNADVNHPRLNFVSNLDDGHEPRGTLSIDRIETCCVGDSGDEGGRAGDGGTTAGGEDGSDSDVFD